MEENNSRKHTTEYIKNKAIHAKRTSLNAIVSLIFSRIMLTGIILMGQIYLLFILLDRMKSSSATWLLYFFSICSMLCIIAIINSDDNPAFKLMWMIPLSVFPVFGVLLYIFIKANPIRFGQEKGLNRRIEETAPYLLQSERVLKQMEEDEVTITDLSFYIRNVNKFPTYDNTEVFYFRSGEEKFFDLLEEIKKAEKFIFLEYFIVSKGFVWNSILELLKEKAATGVEVRLMYDGFNILSDLPHRYGKELEPYGIQVRQFSPVMPFLSSHQNYRDHRKILVIDGKIAYNGGVNLADEYMNYVERFGYWKDTAVKIKGEAVKSFTAMFLQMWNILDKREEEYEKYLGNKICDFKDKSQTFHNRELGYIIPYNDDPCNRLDVAEEVYLDILNKAKKYVWITTPYLIPENEIITGLCFAAQRGVDVRIIMPHIPDKKIAFDIAHTYYPQLMAAGVKMYEFTPGFIHAKMFLSDDCKAVVGTINLDFRSLYEHFECATFIYNNPVILDVKNDFLETFERCQEFTLEDYQKLPFARRIRGKLFRLFAPLM